MIIIVVIVISYYLLLNFVALSFKKYNFKDYDWKIKFWIRFKSKRLSVRTTLIPFISLPSEKWSVSTDIEWKYECVYYRNGFTVTIRLWRPQIRLRSVVRLKMYPDNNYILDSEWSERLIEIPFSNFFRYHYLSVLVKLKLISELFDNY